MRKEDSGRSGDPGRAFISAFQAELLRWNASMNLVSRRDAQKTCAGLVEQCLKTFELFRTWCDGRALLAMDEPLFYVDLGSGAGFPGVIWNQQLFQAGLMPETLFVEPREKRAWFLDRVGSLGGAAPQKVVRGRWGELGEDYGPPATCGAVLVTLKALHLNEFMVLDGLAKSIKENADPSGGFSEVVIARFYPPDQQCDSLLESSLGFPEPGVAVHCSGCSFVFGGCDILGPIGGFLPATLVLTRYQRENFG